MWCGLVLCGVAGRVAGWCGLGRRGEVESGGVWCGVVWCGVVWCGVWCGVVSCGEVRLGADGSEVVRGGGVRREAERWGVEVGGRALVWGLS